MTEDTHVIEKSHLTEEILVTEENNVAEETNVTEETPVTEKKHPSASDAGHGNTSGIFQLLSGCKQLKKAGFKGQGQCLQREGGHTVDKLAATQGLDGRHTLQRTSWQLLIGWSTLNQLAATHRIDGDHTGYWTS